jgi:hypothetical protein
MRMCKKNYVTKANNQLRLAAPKGSGLQTKGRLKQEQLQVDGPSGWSGGFRLPESRMQKQCTTQKSSRATVGVPKETGHYEPMSTVDMNKNKLGHAKERQQCTVKVGYQVAPGIRS